MPSRESIVELLRRRARGEAAHNEFVAALSRSSGLKFGELQRTLPKDDRQTVGFRSREDADIRAPERRYKDTSAQPVPEVFTDTTAFKPTSQFGDSPEERNRRGMLDLFNLADKLNDKIDPLVEYSAKLLNGYDAAKSESQVYSLENQVNKEPLVPGEQPIHQPESDPYLDAKFRTATPLTSTVAASKGLPNSTGKSSTTGASSSSSLPDGLSYAAYALAGAAIGRLISGKKNKWWGYGLGGLAGLAANMVRRRMSYGRI